MRLILGIIEIALSIYILMIFIRFVLSWFPLRSGTPMYRVYDVLYDATEPYLRLFRPLVPLVRMGNAALDLSAMLGLLVLIVVSMIIGAL
ncbi:MAG: YggT family protein [Actinobacteria bacterium]|nr:YggT family protein [Actinomycetota bacterium]